MADEKQWLTKKSAALHTAIMLVIDEYDNGRITLIAAGDRIESTCKDSLRTTYDHAFTEGINSADLDDESEEEISFEFEDDEEGEDH